MLAWGTGVQASGREAGSGSCEWGQGRQGPQTRWHGVLIASAPQFPRTCSKVVQNMVEQLHET